VRAVGRWPLAKANGQWLKALNQRPVAVSHLATVSSPTMEHIDCALCQVDDATLYKEENGFRAMKCRRCGLIYVTPRPTIAEMKRLYDGQETNVDLGAHIRRRDVKSAQARSNLQIIQRYQPGGRLLEIGSAAGYFLYEAKQLGYEVQGVDITHAFAEFSRNELGVPVHEGTLGDAPFPDGWFDVVFMRNVLSHLAEPRAEHQRIHALLKPGGYLVFETGNVGELPADGAGELELPDHLHHFGEPTIRKLLELTGFRVVAVERFGLIEHMWPSRRLAGSGRNEGQAPEPRFPQPPRPVPTMLPPSNLLRRIEGAAGTWVRYGLGRLLAAPGRRSTLIVVAKKEDRR
jgi:SAM-dependent methyltransferase